VLIIFAINETIDLFNESFSKFSVAKYCNDFISFTNLYTQKFFQSNVALFHTHLLVYLNLQNFALMANYKNIFQFLLSFLISKASFSYVILIDPRLQERPEKKEEYRSQEFQSCGEI